MALKRRDIVKAGFIGATAISIGAKDSAAEKSSVIVIGGGLAGLHAAELLVQAGANVVLLEGSRRIGGRVFTGPASAGRPEFGASQIGASYARVVDACARLHVPLEANTNDTPMSMSNRINGQWVRSDRWKSSNGNKMVGDERGRTYPLHGFRHGGRHGKRRTCRIRDCGAQCDCANSGRASATNDGEASVRSSRLNCPVIRALRLRERAGRQ